ncbi:MarR family winged helix-turn-helix transcriptional regulator [Campylobacter fetus]|uniref:MarR family winged helix-turn-helix transcriptional regulator n=3 Tax=Campylobacter fetus TaxID=196 RepID=UPI0018E83474|nr:MarR family transcriptional regulator [Campylobacter fetus]
MAAGIEKNKNSCYNSQVIDHKGIYQEVIMMTKDDKKNAYLYCKFRDEQYALYDEYAKKSGMLMKTLLVLNALYYAKGSMTQKEIAERTFQSKQTVNLIIKNLLHDNYVTVEENPENKRNKSVQLTEEGRLYAKDPVVHITWAEDTAMSMFAPEEQEQLISLSRRFTKNLIELINGSEDEK